MAQNLLASIPSASIDNQAGITRYSLPMKSCVLLSSFGLAVALFPFSCPAQVSLPEELGGPSREFLEQGRPSPRYRVPREPASPAEIRAVLERVLGYLENASAPTVLDLDANAVVKDLDRLPPRAGLTGRDFRLTCYEWGVTYAGMLRMAEVSGDSRYRDYAARRLSLIARLAAKTKAAGPVDEPAGMTPELRHLTLRIAAFPASLDDSGALCAATIKALRAGIEPGSLRPLADNYIAFIAHRQFRLPDGTLARNRPYPNTLWLDDLYMSVPALAQMGKLTGDRSYTDDAARQILQFAERMFVAEKGLFMHGWVQAMDPHPAFHWGRANGWAAMAMTELLEVMPVDHPQRTKILELYKRHLRGLAAYQGRDGLWHQLLDRPDSYEETSASAMFVYAMAHGINRGWLEPTAYSQCVSTGWNAVASKVNERGQVEDTCVGTGMSFDPSFYYYRPVSVFAAHGYGPVLLAGAETLALRQPAPAAR